MCPETMGTSLEDVALILEGSKATVSKIHPIAEALAEKSGNVGENIDHMEKTEWAQVYAVRRTGYTGQMVFVWWQESKEMTIIQTCWTIILFLDVEIDGIITRDFCDSWIN